MIFTYATHTCPHGRRAAGSGQASRFPQLTEWAKQATGNHSLHHGTINLFSEKEVELIRTYDYEMPAEESNNLGWSQRWLKKCTIDVDGQPYDGFIITDIHQYRWSTTNRIEVMAPLVPNLRCCLTKVEVFCDDLRFAINIVNGENA